MLENNSKLIELYGQAAAENNRNITKRGNSQEIRSTFMAAAIPVASF